MMPASMDASIAAAPSEGPTRRSEMAVSSRGSAPPWMRAARSFASVEVKLPVIAVEDDRDAAFRVAGRVAGGRAGDVGPGVATRPVEVDGDDPLDALVALDGAGPGDLLALDDRGADLEGVALVGRQDEVVLLAGLGVRLGRREHLVDGQLGRGADLLLGLLRLLVTGDAGQLDEDAVLALAHERGLGDTEGVDAAAEHLQGLVDVLRARGRLLGALGLEHELRTAPEIETQVRLDVERERRAPGQEAEHEDEANPHTT